ncbi:MAG: glycosyltransferase family 10 [Paludibacter sp.]|nr:glycosyltransferase family 10 [Paludibacter sp.]
MKEIRIFFTDFWRNFNNEDNFFVSALKPHYKIILDAQNPEYLFYSWHGTKHFKYKNAVKIYFTGENDVPNFNICDYGISSVHLNFGKRHFRLPLYAVWDDYDQLFIPKNTNFPKKSKFCNFVYSNAKRADPIRDKFFQRLSQYKKIDSGGRYLNNIGSPVANKMDFIKDYKFTIAFENSAVSGYTTEKLLQPMLVNSMPIYWGNPDVELDFNTKSFVHFSPNKTMDEVIEEIIFLDNNDKAYFEKLSQVWAENPKNYTAELSNFLQNIVNSPLNSAKQTTNYGYMNSYKHKLLIGSTLCESKILRPLLKKIIK